MPMPQQVAKYNQLSTISRQTRNSDWLQANLQLTNPVMGHFHNVLLTYPRDNPKMHHPPSAKMSTKNPSLSRKAAESQGRTAEVFVAEQWQSRGFSILARRLRTKAGEIDLVVADSSTLVFIEVKSRKSFEQAAYAVAPRQQARIFQAADSALAEHDEWSRPNIRFDIALYCNGAVEHIHDAIRAY